MIVGFDFRTSPEVAREAEGSIGVLILESPPDKELWLRGGGGGLGKPIGGCAAVGPLTQE